MRLLLCLATLTALAGPAAAQASEPGKLSLTIYNRDLALVQEQSLGLLRGGIVAQQEQTFVDGCVRLEGFDTPQAITRTKRLVIYGDGTSLEVVFSGRPTPTNMTCP